MRKFWNIVIHLGVDEAVNPLEVRFITLVNALAAVVSLFYLSYILILIRYLLQIKFLIYFLATAGILNLGTLLLNYFKLYFLARQYFHFVSLTSVIILSVLLGKETLIHFFLLESIVAAFFIYPVREKLFMYAKIFIDGSVFIALEIWLSYHGAMSDVSPDFFAIIKYGVLAGLLILMVAIAFYSYAIINRSEARLEKERQKSENLLLNILPKSVTKRLKVDAGCIADRFDEATILFSDIVNFSEMVKTMPADKMVSMLDEIFTEFDLIADQYGLEKIKTIGDAYMVAGGVPEPSADHCKSIANMALSMQRAVQTKLSRKFPGLKLRIGIHIGPVVAGVIGQRKFIYDLWGDSVNTASRMESCGLEDKIQVSSEVYERLKNHYQFEFRGDIDMKGKGKMPAYFLIDRK